MTDKSTFEKNIIIPPEKTYNMHTSKLKIFRNDLLSIAEISQNKGLLFFKITVNLPHGCNWSADSLALLKKKLTAINVSVEKYTKCHFLGINPIDEYNINVGKQKQIWDWHDSNPISLFPGIDALFYVVERKPDSYSQYKYEYLHVFATVRSFLGYNEVIAPNFNKHLRSEYVDIEVTELQNLQEVQNWLQFLYKIIQTKEEQDYLEKQNTEVVHDAGWIIYSHINEATIYRNACQSQASRADLRVKLQRTLYFRGVCHEIQGWPFTSKQYSPYTLVLLIQLICYSYKWYLYKNVFYKNKEESSNSIEFLFALEDIKQALPKFFNDIKITSDIVFNLPCNIEDQLNGLPIHELYAKYIDNALELIANNNNLIQNFYRITTELVEFRDGFYSFKHNLFINHSENIDMSHIKCFHFVNKNYISYSKPPHNWLALIKQAIGNQIEEAKLCIGLGSLLHATDTKQSILYVWGPSNSGKTALVVKTIINFFGKENVRLITSSDAFRIIQGLPKKNVTIFDNFVYNEKDREIYLNFLDLNSKFLQKKIYKTPEGVDNSHVVFVSNFQPSKDPAISLRIREIEFRTTINNIDFEKYLKKLNNEDEALRIMLYCNKMYFKNKGRSFSKEKNKKELLIKLEPEKNKRSNSNKAFFGSFLDK